MTAKTPILFGVDPDEVWRYVPEAARPAKLPAFLLKAPSLAVTVKRDELLVERRNRTIEIVPGVLDEIREIAGEEWSIKKPAADVSDEEKTDYIERCGRFESLSARWYKAFADSSADFREREDEIELRILAESVTGWEGLQSASGKAISFETAKGRLGEVLRGKLRDEVIAAALAGTFVSEDDAEGLHSSPA